MNDRDDTSLNERVAALEDAVRDLRWKVAVLSAGPGSKAAPGPEQRAGSPGASITAERPSVTRPSAPFSEQLKRMLTINSEALFNRIGIALLLLGVAFLFKYSIDRGWITEAVRVAFGACLGTFLLAAGVRVTPRRPRLAPILNAGGIAILYGSVYAAYAFYGLIDVSAGFGLMFAVTVVAFVVSIYQGEAPLSAIAVLGGLATPLVVNTHVPDPSGVSVYVSVIVAGTVALYMVRGWRLPLFTAAGLALLVLFFGFPGSDSTTGFERLVQQGGVLVYWAALGLAPVARERLQRSDPLRWPSPDMGNLSDITLIRRPALLLSVTTPLAAIALSAQIWPHQSTLWGWVCLAVGAGYVAGALLLDRSPDLDAGVSAPVEEAGGNRLAQSHRLTAVVLFLAGPVIILDTVWHVLVFAAGYTLLDFVARRIKDRALAIVGYASFGLTIPFWLGNVVGSAVDSASIFGIHGIAGLVTVILWAVYAGRWLSGRPRLVVAVVAHILFLTWMLSKLGSLPNGEAYVTLSWGIYAISLFLLGLRWKSDPVRLTGMLTLLTVIGKLLIFDLESLDAVWRILLFLGFGGILLLLSYYVPDLWKTGTRAPDEDVVAS